MTGSATAPRCGSEIGNPDQLQLRQARAGLLETNALGGTTSREYNGFGEAWKITNPGSGTTYRSVRQLGRVTHVRDAGDYLTETQFTTFGEISIFTRRFNQVSGGAAMAMPPAVAANAGEDLVTSFLYGQARADHACYRCDGLLRDL